MNEAERGAALASWDLLASGFCCALIVETHVDGPLQGLTKYLANLRVRGAEPPFNPHSVAGPAAGGGSRGAPPPLVAAIRALVLRVALKAADACAGGKQMAAWGGTPINPNGEVLAPDLEPLVGDGGGVLRALRLTCRFMYGKEVTDAAFKDIYDPRALPV